MSTSEPSLIKGFKKLIADGDLAQGYVFFGLGSKLEFAQSFANYLETQKWQPATKLLLDALFVESADYFLIRQFLWQKPLVSPKRMAVIQNADRLTILAQNAILKITEEPPKSALIILITNDSESLIATLASRFQKIYFPNPRFTLVDQSRLAEEFLKSNFKQRREIIKVVIDDDGLLENFVAGLIKELSRDKIKNWKALKELLNRWSLIKRYNVNKKLQLEAWTKLLS